MTAAPAYAFGDLYLTVNDASTGGPFGDQGFTLTPVGGGAPYESDTYSDGTRTLGTMDAGDYYFNPVSTLYVHADVPVTIADSANYITVDVDKYKVEGSVLTGTSAGTTVDIQFNPGSGFATSSTESMTGDTFEFRLSDGPGTYRLFFHPGASLDYVDTYSAEFVIDGSTASYSLGTVSFDEAGVIRGTISDYPGLAAIDGATVNALSGSTIVASAVSGSTGEYAIRLPRADATVTISAEAVGYQPQTYLTFPFPVGGSPVTIDASNGYSVSGIDIALPSDLPDVAGNLVGGGGSAYSVDTFLYKKDGSTNLYAQTPYGKIVNSSTFSFLELPDGDYRLAFRDNASEETLVWNSLSQNGAPATSGSATGDCYIQFSVDASVGNVLFSNVSLAQEQIYPATCVNPAHSDAGDAVVTGSVLNYADDFDYIAYAKLYMAGAGLGGPTLIDSSQLEYPSGSFSLTGVRDVGEYYIKITPYPGDAMLTTLLGESGETAWLKDFQTEIDFGADHSFTVDPSDPATLNGHDVTIDTGSVIHGSITNGTGDWINAGLLIADATDPTDTIFVPVSSYGNFTVTVPAGGTYTLLATSVEGDYIDEYWQNASTIDDAETVGPLVAGSSNFYEFRLSPSKASLYGFVNDASSSDPITIHLFFKDDNGFWQPLDQKDTDFQQAYFTKNYDTGLEEGLVAGDYRMRFQDSNGMWLSAINYRTGTLPSGGPTEPGPTCFVDIAGVTDGFPSMIDVNFDSATQTEVCEAEPPTEGDVTGHLVSSVATGEVDIANTEVYFINNYTYDYFTATTDVDGNFTFNDVPNGTYELAVMPVLPPSVHVDGTHEYFFRDEFTVAGGGNLNDIVPARFGNASGTIANWDDATMAGATATVYTLGGCGCATAWGPALIDPGFPVPITVDITETGHFEVPGILQDGSYSVWIDFPDTYVDTFVNGGLIEPDAPFTGTAEMDYTYLEITLELEELISISGTAFYGTYPLEYGEVYADTEDGAYYFEAEVDADGNYEIWVAPNRDYLVSVYYDPLLVQYYDGYNYDPYFSGPFVGTTIELGDMSITGIDFSLVAPQEDYFWVYTGTAGPVPGSSYSFSDVDVHLYKYVVDGWEEVDTETSNPYADLESSDGGTYRLRFSKDGDWLSVEETRWDNYLPPYEETYGFVEVDACYIEFSGLAHGSQLSIDAILDPDGASSGCAEETLAEHYVVRGTLDKTGNIFGGPVDTVQTLQLRNAADVLIGEVESDPTDGSFGFSGVSPGTYSITVLQAPYSDTEHSYAEKVVTGIVVDDNEWVGSIELTRFGDAVLQLDNWDAALAGATAQLWVSTDGGTTFAAVGEVDEVDSSGQFVISGIAVDGVYAIWIDYPTGFVDGYYGNGTPLPSHTFNGYAEYDQTGLTATAYVDVSGTVSAGATPVPGALVHIISSLGDHYYASTDSDGYYSSGVPVGVGLDFDIEVEKAGYVFESDFFDTDVYTPVTLDFSLFVVKFETLVYDDTTSNPTGLVHLYKKVTGGWQEVAVSTGHYASQWSTLSGSYRLRFSEGSTWLPVTEYGWSTVTSSTSTSGTVTPPTPVCYIEFDPATGGATYTNVVYVDSTPTANTCAAEPAVVAPPITPGTVVTKKGAGPAAAEEVEEEVVPTSTPTPTPEPSETATDEPDDASAVDKPTTTSAPDFTWAFWAAGILALFVLAGGAVFFVRRRP